MSIYGVTAIRKCGTELYNEARSWACTLDLPYIPRPIHGTLDQLLREKGLKAVLVATHQGPQVYTEEGILKYHPSMGVPRIRNLKRGGSDHLAQACGFRTGMRVLDCTLGLAADAVVASFLVGPEGKVVGLEASPVLYWAVSQGLKTYPSTTRTLPPASGGSSPGWAKRKNCCPRSRRIPSMWSISTPCSGNRWGIPPACSPCGRLPTTSPWILP